MRTVEYRTFGLALALALTAPLAACTPPASPVAPTTVAAANATSPGERGTIRLDVSRLFGGANGAGERRTLGYGLAPDRVTHVRLRLMSPGSSGSTLLTPTPVALDTSSTLNKKVECTIAAGPNQVVTVEALDASGVMLMSLRGATNVPAGGVATVQVGMVQDLVGRIIEKLIIDGAPYLTNESLIGSLTTFVNDVIAYNGTAPQYYKAENFTDNFRESGEPYGWLTTEALTAWLAEPSSKEMVGSGFFESGTLWHLALTDVVKPAVDFPVETYDPTLWRASVIAPIGGVWNTYENVVPEFIPANGEVYPYAGGYYFRIGGLPPLKYTLLVTHPVNNTKLVYDLSGGYDGPFFFSATRRI